MLEKIDKYFKNELSLSERQDFDNEFVSNEEFRKNISFYLNSRTAAKQLADDKRRVEFEELRKNLSRKSDNSSRIKPMIWLSGLAASVVLAVGFWWFSRTPDLAMNAIADTYIQEHFQNLPVKMDASADSLQMGLRLFNEQKLGEAQNIFESVLARNSNDSEAIKYLGITYLRMKDYDKAVQYFQNLASQEELFANPGKFYQAIALLQQSLKNEEQAEILLKEVIDNDLEGKEEAQKMLGSY
ncbi:MAG: tetratricopeptide repeat protein [Arcicella sp.]|nr:tetratricopeptide repeat protein [Arcicella sp.]